MAAHDATLSDTPLTPREGARGDARVLALPWHRLALGAILLLATFLNCWQLGRLGYGNSYYAAAVRSMLRNWHNFFFNSFDPGGFVTIDKPPLGFWFQVLSAKIFGYNGVSLLLPSVLAGILSVWLLYHLVSRVFGRPAGLLAALALAVTPVAVATNRSNIIDSILVLFLLLAAWAVSLAAERGSLRLLVLCAVLVGLGFNIKMLEAYLVLPAFGVVYLLGAPRTWLVRIVHLAIATVVLLVVSFSWAVAVDLTPASQRPWVDSTTTNSELDLAIGYNGLQRLTGQNRFGGRPSGNLDFNRRLRIGDSGTIASGIVPGNSAPSGTSGGATSGFGSIPPSQRTGGQSALGASDTGIAPRSTSGRSRLDRGSRGAFSGGAGRPGGGMFNNGPAGPFRLFGQDLGGQASWLLPLALIGLVAVASRRLIRLPLEHQERGALLWGAWLLSAGGFFSVAGFFHSYYLVTLAPAVAALAGIALVTLWHDYRRRGWRGWLLPAALLVTAAVQVSLLRPYADWSRWLSPLVVGMTVLAAAVLVIARLRPRRTLRLWTPVAAAAGMLALLLAPTAWAADTMANGGGMTPSAGPSAFSMPGLGGGRGRPNVGDGGATNSGLLKYLEQHQGTATYLLAVQNSNSAASYIIQTGKPVMSLGGFGGNDPILTLTQLQALVKNNTVRYFSGVGGFGSTNSIGQWVQSACTAVPASAYGGSTSSGMDMGQGGFPTGNSAGSGFPTGGVPGNGATPPGGNQGPPPGFTPGAGFPSLAGGFGGRGQQLYDCSGAVK